MAKKVTMKEKVLCFVENQTEATFTEIQRFIFDTIHGKGSYDAGYQLEKSYNSNTKTWVDRKRNANRGYYCGAFSKGYYNAKERSYNPNGYFLRGDDCLVKLRNGKYCTVRSQYLEIPKNK